MMGEQVGPGRLLLQHALEQFVPQDHPLRAIRPLIDTKAIRRTVGSLYSSDRPTVDSARAAVSGAGRRAICWAVTSDRKLVMELQCNMALRWFVGLNLDQNAWDASTFSQNRRRRFDGSGVLEKLFDETVKRAIAEGLVSRHVSADGTLVRANASFKSFVPIEVAMDPEEYKKRLRAQTTRTTMTVRRIPGNRAVDFRGRSAATRPIAR